jgi:hypothetical protein
MLRLPRAVAGGGGEGRASCASAPRTGDGGTRNIGLGSESETAWLSGDMGRAAPGAACGMPTPALDAWRVRPAERGEPRSDDVGGAAAAMLADAALLPLLPVEE